MRTTTTQTQNAFLAAWKGGTARPAARATISRLQVRLDQYGIAYTPQLESVPRDAKGAFASVLFGQRDRPVELPNIKSVRWQRSVETEVATLTMVLWNCEVLPIGQAPDSDLDIYERPGYFTPGHGLGDTPASFGQTANAWQSLIVPDRIIRTYEGYGYDAAEIPEIDPHMYPSGVWMVDEVIFDTRGLITITARDIGRCLIDHICFPPVVPYDQYPISWSTFVPVANPPIYTSTTSWFRPTYDTDSNIPYIGAGFSDGGVPYVDNYGGVRKHYGKHAFDGNSSTYWLSVGNYPSWSSAYEYVQGKFSSRTVQAVKFKPWGGPYTAYISVYANGSWQGRSKIPYNARAVDTNADIKFVKSLRVKPNTDIVVKLPKAYTGATKIRITFTDLYDSGIGNFQYRAGCYDISVSSSVSVATDGGTHQEGNYGDYADIVKWLLAWGGFHWPAPDYGTKPSGAYQTLSDGTRVYITPTSGEIADSILPNAASNGTVWGDFEDTGTAGKVDLGVEIFDKKPLMDGITYIRDIVNYVFFVDELGGAVFRSPNIWSIGNYMSSSDGGPHTGRTTSVIDLDADTSIMDLSAKLSSRAVREKVFVSNVNGEFGAVAAGYNPAPSGLRRVGGWTDQNFETEEECQIMADLITVRQMFRYRTNNVTIPGNPAIQIDDQVRLYEPTTAETYYHYVKSIGSDIDLETGKWTYSLETFWLGESPFDRWAFDPAKLSWQTNMYLATQGKV